MDVYVNADICNGGNEGNIGNEYALPNVTLVDMRENKAGYTATEVVCGWAGAIFEVTRSFGQEQ